MFGQETKFSQYKIEKAWYNIFALKWLIDEVEVAFVCPANLGKSRKFKRFGFLTLLVGRTNLNFIDIYNGRYRVCLPEKLFPVQVYTIHLQYGSGLALVAVYANTRSIGYWISNSCPLLFRIPRCAKHIYVFSLKLKHDITFIIFCLSTLDNWRNKKKNRDDLRSLEKKHWKF